MVSIGQKSSLEGDWQRRKKHVQGTSHDDIVLSIVQFSNLPLYTSAKHCVMGWLVVC